MVRRIFFFIVLSFFFFVANIGYETLEQEQHTAVDAKRPKCVITDINWTSKKQIEQQRNYLKTAILSRIGIGVQQELKFVK